MQNQPTTDDARKQLQRSAKLHWMHWLILSLSLVVTFFAWYFSQKQVNDKAMGQFDREATQVEQLILERLTLYEQALWAAVAKIQADGGQTNFNNWRRYVLSLNLMSQYPGINGIGIIEYIPADKIAAYLKKERQQRPNYRVYPKHNHSFILPISYVIPLKGNEKAIGLDMAHEQNRLTAAMKARDSGKAQITGPIILVQDKAKTPGFLFYAPFYYGGSYDNKADRIQHFQGMVYAPFIVSKLMDGVLSKQNRHIDVQISDGNKMLYDEIETNNKRPESPFFRSQTHEIFGRQWNISLRASPEFIAANSSNDPMTILIAGVFIDALLLFLFFSMTRANTRALQYANHVTEALEKKTRVLKRSNEELNQFAYAASHDLRAPLRGIEQLVSWIIEDDGENLHPETKDRLLKMQKRVMRMHGLINGILDYSQLGNQHANINKVDLNILLLEIIDGLGSPPNVEISIPEPLPVVEANAILIGQVFSNLITNAIKHNDKEQIKICIRSVEESHQFEFYVEDNGPGIDEVYHKKVFDLFHTLKPKDEIETSGVGLALIKKVVESVDGEVDIISTAGQGCTFKFSWQKGLKDAES